MSSKSKGRIAYSLSLCPLPDHKKAGRYDLMLHDLMRILKPSQSAWVHIEPDTQDVDWNHKMNVRIAGSYFSPSKPSDPHFTVPNGVQFVFSVPWNQYDNVKRSLNSSMRRLHYPLTVCTRSKKLIVTRLSDPT
jgi:hypothetical protein